MDEPIESFLADVLALKGEMRTRSAKGCASLLPTTSKSSLAREVNKSMNDKAAHVCHALCRARVIEEIQTERRTADHLTLVLSIIDGPRFPVNDK
jgi:hypothetical protein